jgi:hypothetical protein
MTDKEKYKDLIRRYWNAETTPEEEQDLAQYVAIVDDAEFDDIRAVLGFLSIGRDKIVRRARLVRIYSFAAIAVTIVALVVSGLNLIQSDNNINGEICVQYTYGNISHNNAQIMSSVETSLEDFFSERATR